MQLRKGAYNLLPVSGRERPGKNDLSQNSASRRSYDADIGIVGLDFEFGGSPYKSIGRGLGNAVWQVAPNRGIRGKLGLHYCRNEDEEQCQRQDGKASAAAGGIN